MTNKFISKGVLLRSKRDSPASAGNVSPDEGIGEICNKLDRKRNCPSEPNFPSFIEVSSPTRIRSTYTSMLPPVTLLQFNYKIG
jgi:hypothetical protein